MHCARTFARCKKARVSPLRYAFERLSQLCLFTARATILGAWDACRVRRQRAYADSVSQPGRRHAVDGWWNRAGTGYADASNLDNAMRHPETVSFRKNSDLIENGVEPDRRYLSAFSAEKEDPSLGGREHVAARDIDPDNRSARHQLGQIAEKQTRRNRKSRETQLFPDRDRAFWPAPLHDIDDGLAQQPRWPARVSHADHCNGSRRDAGASSSKDARRPGKNCPPRSGQFPPTGLRRRRPS